MEVRIHLLPCQTWYDHEHNEHFSSFFSLFNPLAGLQSVANIQGHLRFARSHAESPTHSSKILDFLSPSCVFAQARCPGVWCSSRLEWQLALILVMASFTGVHCPSTVGLQTLLLYLCSCCYLANSGCNGMSPWCPYCKLYLSCCRNKPKILSNHKSPACVLVF